MNEGARIKGWVIIHIPDMSSTEVHAVDSLTLLVGWLSPTARLIDGTASG